MTARTVKRITVTKRYQNYSWTLLFRGIPPEIKQSGRHAHSLKLRRKKEDANTAEDILTVVKAELALGKPFGELSCFKNTTEKAGAAALLVDHMAERYFEDRAHSSKMVDTTLYKTKNVYHKWVSPLLGQREAASVEPGDVITLINTVTSAGKALSYAALIVRRLSSIYSWGITALKLKDSSARRFLNPCIDPGLREYLSEDKEKRRGGGTKRKRAFGEEDEEAFLAKIRELYGYEPWFFWLTMFRTGLRVGECIALELSDFQRLTSPDPTLHVHQTWTQKGRHEHRKNVRDLYIHLGLFPSYVDAKTFLPVSADLGAGKVDLEVFITPVERSLNAYPKYLDMFAALKRGAPAAMEPLPGWMARRRRDVPPANEVLASIPSGAAILPPEGGSHEIERAGGALAARADAWLPPSGGRARPA